jgi:hypothetical protein
MRLKMMAVLAGALASTGAGSSRADDAAVAPLDTKLIAVSLFKNGVGFMAREGELPKGDVKLLVDGLPAAVHGTFWVYSRDDAAAVKDLVAFEKESAQTMQALSVAEMVEANVGETVEIRTGDRETIRGKILAVPADRPAPPPSAPPGRLLYPYTPPSAEAASLVLLQTDTGMIALNKNSIVQISRAGGELKTSVERKKRGVALQLRAANPAGKGRVVVQYLARGITWAPSCAIDITDGKRARITAKAEIVNEIEDLDNVAVNFITGFPNLQFADVTDPMALRQDLAAFLQSLLNPAQPGQPGGGRSVVMNQAVAITGASEGGEIFPVFPGGALEGQTREELFFYEQKGVSLKKGERGYYPLYTMEVPYEHAYEWKIGDTLDEQERYRGGDPREAEKAEEVWHSVRLQNTGKVPWTTAPALTMQGGQVLGQDLIHYTSPGGKTTVKITQAVDIKAERAEFEVERKRNAATFYNSSYDLVTVRGRLKITSFKTKDATLSITKDLSGEVVKTLPEAKKVDQVVKGLRKVNPHSVLYWEIPLRARAKAEVEYNYRVYVRD